MKGFDEFFEEMKRDDMVPDEVWARYTDTLENLPEKKKRRGVMPAKAAVLLLCGLFLAGGGVYAAGQKLNIAWFLHRTDNAVPEKASALVNGDIEVVNCVQEGQELVEVKPEEVLSDTNSVLTLVRVSAKEKGKYLLLPQDTDPASYMYMCYPDTDSQLTVSEYAREHDLQIVYVDAWYTQDGNWKLDEKDAEAAGSSTEKISIENAAEDELVYMLEAGKKPDVKQADVTVKVTAGIYDPKEMTAEEISSDRKKTEEIETTFRMQDTSSETMCVYEVEDGNALEKDGVHIQSIKASQTEFRTYLRMTYSSENRNTYVEFAVLDADGKELNFADREGEVLADEDGQQKALLVYDRDTVEEQNVVLGYSVRNVEDGTVKNEGTVTLKKVQ